MTIDFLIMQKSVRFQRLFYDSTMNTVYIELSN